jgi:Uncharacterised protein family (UPF0259)
VRSDAARRPGLQPLFLLADVGRAYAKHWYVLVPLAVVLLLPQALADALDPSLETEDLDLGRAVLLALSLAALVAIGLGGEAMYAGVISALIVRWRAGAGAADLGEIARSLPYGRLIVADLILAAGTALGLALLIVPGVVFITYFLLTTVLIEIERLRVVAAMRRSAALVMGHFWPVLALVLLFVAGTELLTAALEAPLHGIELESAVNLVIEAGVEPLQGLATVLVCLKLIELRGESRAPVHSASGRD